MKFSARIERGDWANQVRRLIDAYGKGADEVLRSQARLFVRDAMRFTPPFSNAPITESWQTQRMAGFAAIIRDMKGMMSAASQLRVLSSGSDVAAWLAGLARDNKGKFIDTLQTKFRLGFGDVLDKPDKKTVDAALDSRKRYRRNQQSYIIHNGNIPSYFNASGRLAVPPELAAIVQERTALVGLAKAGWVKAAQALGMKGIPPWVKKKAGRSQGIYETDGSGLTVSYTVGSRVPWMQARGRELNIIGRAWRNRQRNIEKEIERVLKANARKALKGSK